MNPFLSDWNTEAAPVSSQKKPFGVDHDLVELLWQDGHVVLHSQNVTNKKSESDDQTMMKRGSGNPSNLIQENENMSSWLHDSGPIDDDPFEKEFCSNFSMNEFHSSSNLIQTNNQFEHNKICKLPNNHVVPNSQHPLPPPKYLPSSTKMKAQIKNNGPTPPSNGQLKIIKGRNKAVAPSAPSENKEGCSAMAVGSSHCGSNQVADISRVRGMDNNRIVVGNKEHYDVGKLSPQSDKDTVEKAANTSSSGGSGSSFGVRTTYNQSTTTNSHKRKGRDDAADSESPSETAELESAAAGNNKSGQRSGKRSRAAEVHNLSERRRRDRINEKMRALQELIPHSNKSDKASMLDEAIEYMKSLQLQLQMLWMGSGMAASMMFPSIQQQYLSRMGMSAAAMGAPPTLPSLPSLHNTMHQQHLTRMPMLDQTMASPIPPTPNQAALLNQINYPNQFNTPNFSDQYAAFIGFQQLQNATQPINMFNFGSHAAQPNSNIAPPSHCNGPPI